MSAKTRTTFALGVTADRQVEAGEIQKAVWTSLVRLVPGVVSVSVERDEIKVVER